MALRKIGIRPYSRTGWPSILVNGWTRRAGQSRGVAPIAPPGPAVMTFSKFADIWKNQKGVLLARPCDNEYRLIAATQGNWRLSCWS
jgi:hypothetical protein